MEIALMNLFSSHGLPWGTNGWISKGVPTHMVEGQQKPQPRIRAGKLAIDQLAVILRLKFILYTIRVKKNSPQSIISG